MSDDRDIVKRLQAACHDPEGEPLEQDGRSNATVEEVELAIIEIARFRALCDRQSTALSLSGMRHGRILVGLERRNARQRRALAKLYQRRHDKNAEIARLRAALATARLEGMKEAADLCNELVDHKGGICAIAIRVMIDEEEKRAAIRAGAKEDNRPSEEIIREDRDAWLDHQANDPIGAAAKESRQQPLMHLDASDTQTFIINQDGELMGLQNKSEKEGKP